MAGPLQICPSPIHHCAHAAQGTSPARLSPAAVRQVTCLSTCRRHLNCSSAQVCGIPYEPHFCPLSIDNLVLLISLVLFSFLLQPSVLELVCLPNMFWLSHQVVQELGLNFLGSPELMLPPSPAAIHPPAEQKGHPVKPELSFIRHNRQKKKQSCKQGISLYEAAFSLVSWFNCDSCHHMPENSVFINVLQHPSPYNFALASTCHWAELLNN